MGVSRRIRLIDDKILIKTIIAVRHKPVRNPLTLGIQDIYVEPHSVVEERTGRIFSDELGHGRIIHLIGQLVDYVRLSGTNAIS